MPTTDTIKPKHKAIAAYYQALQAYSDQQVNRNYSSATARNHFGRIGGGRQPGVAEEGAVSP